MSKKDKKDKKKKDTAAPPKKDAGAPKDKGGKPGGSGGKSGIAWMLWFLFFLVIFLPVYFFKMNTFNLPFTDASEAREAETVGEMVNFHDPLTPYPNEDRIPTKPPVFHWLAAIVSALLNGVSEFSIRFAALLYAAGIALSTFFLAKSMLNGRAAFLSAIVLVSSIVFWNYSSAARVDMALTFFCTTAFLFFYLGFESDKGGYFILSFVCVAFAILAKGPVGLAIPALPIIIFIIAKRAWKTVWREDTILGLIAMVVIVCGYYMIAGNKYGFGEYNNLLMNESIKRVTEPGGLYNDSFMEPWYWFMPKFFGFFMPWSVILPLALIFCFGKGMFSEKGGNLYALLWFLIVFIGFSLIDYKRKAYLIPAIPAASILTGSFLDSVMEDCEGRRAALLSVFSVVYMILGILLFVCAIAFLAPDVYDITIGKLASGRTVKILEQFSSKNSHRNLAEVLAISSVLCITGSVLMLKKKFLAGVISIVMMFVVCTSAASFWIVPILYGSPDNPRTFVRNNIEPNVKEDDFVGFYGNGYDYAVIFYAKRRIPMLGTPEVSYKLDEYRNVYLILAEEDITDLEMNYPRTFELAGDKYRCTKKNLVLMKRKTGI
ncbi:MAG: glycosyltransferase family 39 protein [Planctomycetes bacterium]|nr:glycosyltransferase family 39 protein [Planctomycetota bacterium]